MKTSKLSIPIVIVLCLPAVILFFSANKPERKAVLHLENARYFNGMENDDLQLSKIYSSLDYLPIKLKERSSNTPFKIIMGKERLFIIGYEFNTLNIYDRKGQLISTINPNSSGIKFSQIADFAVDEATRQIYIGDTELKKIFKFDYEGNYISELNLGMHFVSFNYSSVEKKFIFYVPMPFPEADLNRNSIAIFDQNLNIIHKLFPLHGLCYDFNPLASNRFVKFGERSFFNPPLSGSIYELFYDGTYSKVFEIPVYDQKGLENSVSDLIKNSKLSPKLARQINGLVPISNFLVSNEEVIIEKFFNQFPHYIILNTKKKQSVIIGSRIKNTNFGDEFGFVFSRPKFSSMEGLISHHSNLGLGTMFNAIEGNSEANKIVVLKDAVANGEDLLLIYQYDFDFLFQNSTEDLSPLFQKTKVNGQQELPTDLKVYPNPSSKDVKIEFTFKPNKLNLKLIGLSGGVIQSQIVESQNGHYSAKFEVDKLDAGVYFISIFLPDGQIKTQQIQVK